MISNKTKGFIIAEKHYNCRSVFSKSHGLMFSRPKVLVFYFSKPARVSLHMWFVFFPIDVLFLDEHNTVVEVKKNFKPFSFYIPSKKVVTLIEAPAGKIRDTRVGDIIEIKE